MDKSGHTPVWQANLARGVSSVEELLCLLRIDVSRGDGLPFAGEFPLRVPRGFVARMETGNPQDPLLRQVLPLQAEETPQAGYCRDPLNELHAMPVPGLLHKYRSRALLTLTGACAIHCRYCFRRHFPYSGANPLTVHWQQVLDYLGNHTGINEIILSGGDPLLLPDSRLQEVARQLAAIPHIRTLRLHTRLPVVLPERIDDQLLAWLGTYRRRIVMVIHCNHPQEIDDTVVHAMDRLSRAGVLLLNQAVLLKGVNDDATTLIDLSEALFAAGVLPYYLHQLDRVQGAAHFAVNEVTAGSLMDAVHAALPGYLVPRLVTELPGFPGKRLLWPGAAEAVPARGHAGPATGK
ncbi:MAG: EF-P beta-lysylation protein EpmB [Gammaproteobacteria bacterium]